VQECASSEAAAALATLREHLPDLQQLFTERMDSNGSVSLSTLRAAVADAALDWGLLPDTVRGLLCPEALFTGVLEVNADDSGEPALTRAEFIHALDARSAEKRVCRAVQLHLSDVKAGFYRLSGAPCADSQLSLITVRLPISRPCAPCPR
jgi:hypothetical protein